MVCTVTQLSEIGYLDEVMKILALNQATHSAFRLYTKSRKCTFTNIYCEKSIKYFIAISNSYGYSEQMCSCKC